MEWAPLVGQARWLPPSGDCGSVATCHRAMVDRAEGRRPENRPCGDDSDPGLASRRERDPTARRCTGARRPWTACARFRRGGPIRYDVAASYYLIRYECRTTGTDYWDIHSYIFPIVSSASVSLLALFQTLRRHRCRLLRQRLDYSIPSRVVVTSDLAGSGRLWSPSDWLSEHSCCRHGDVSLSCKFLSVVLSLQCGFPE